jgi:hypothetical protein
MHCWHQRVRLRVASPTDKYGDVVVSPEKSREAHRKWIAMTRPADPDKNGGLRRPREIPRPLSRDPEAYNFKVNDGE